MSRLPSSSAILALLLSFEAIAASELNVQIESIQNDTLKLSISNNGSKAAKIYPLEGDPSWSIDIWIQDRNGNPLSSDLFGDGNWYNNPCPISDMAYYTKKVPKIRLRSGESHDGIIQLSSALRYLSDQPTKERISQAVGEEKERLERLLPKATNPPYETSLAKRLEPSNGPFRIKVRWREIESNWISLERIDLETDIHYSPSQSVTD